MKDYLGRISTIFAVFTVIITLYFQSEKETSLESILFFGIIIVVILFYFIYIYTKDKLNEIDKNTEKIVKLEDKVNYMKQIYELDKRVSLLEKQKKRKAHIDPRVVFIIILAILLYLYLKSLGVIS